METESSWHQWKHTLGRAVNLGKAVGLSDDTINNAAYRFGEFFANHFDPGNREQRLLKELWEQGDDHEKRTLAGMLSRMVDSGETR
ncbi:DUF3243 domain-containing protein [Desulfocucumis palustris]|nr:DUF3243 domain-containing protein [Desulfocucumis palustris]